MKKISSLLLSLLLAFTMTGNSFAVNVMPGLDLDSADGVDIELIKHSKNPCYDASTKTLTLNLIEGYDTGILNWNKFNLKNGFTLNYGAGTFINNVASGVTTINGNLNGINANVYFNALQGAYIGNKANINIKSGMISTLPTKETDIAALRARIENDKMLELEITNPEDATRYGIMIHKNAKITYTNRLDFVSAKIIDSKKQDLVSNSPNLVYTTTDGIVFKLEDSGAVDSIYSSAGLPANKDVSVKNKWYITQYTAPIEAPAPPVIVPEPEVPVLPKILSLTDNSPKLDNILPDKNLRTTDRLINLQTKIAQLEKTPLIGNLDNIFNNGTISSIAINNGTSHMFAADEFTPVGAAAQSQNTKASKEKYDFIITQAIYE